MTHQDQPQRSGTTSADPAEGAEAPAVPLSRMLANPRRVRRA
ncbi:hypothetical protein SAMN05660199_04384 [Klenkia soli]|uniref:Uncharacterized protein n=1 Tax=Klenkia soli TaxID=1052260 RepID=A0A1H0U5K8_9ACTN|nr:hypothetical protein [Klenkia soli]SDP61431.1 hypothetical protein SAMN05660199_04384 [Klenkia soli]